MGVFRHHPLADPVLPRLGVEGGRGDQDEAASPSPIAQAAGLTSPRRCEDIVRASSRSVERCPPGSVRATPHANRRVNDPWAGRDTRFRGYGSGYPTRP